MTRLESAFYNKGMDSLEKLAQIADYMDDEIDEHVEKIKGSACPVISEEDNRAAQYVPRHKMELPIYQAAMPNGQHMAMLKTLLTSACEKNCAYCCFRAGRDFRRQTFLPDELARTFIQLWQKGAVRGLFLSSGVAGGGLLTQDRLLDTAEILRKRLGYPGYLHLKIMPGAERAQVERAMQLADRVSINLEAPNSKRLALLAPQKGNIEELLTPLRWVEEIRRKNTSQHGWKGRWPSSTTQFVAGGAGESDEELLQTSAYLHNNLHLTRVYFSGFHPVPETPLENEPPIQPWRQNRLYQADFLLRDYGFHFEDFCYDPSGNLDLEVDPKLAWARRNLSQAPVDINQADYSALLRIPGIGPIGAHAILSARRSGKFKSLEDLSALGVHTSRAAPFILLDGKRPSTQMSLW
ncbi:MAG TPA: radical SAM protein [Anaerolineaceae bacterium]|nr:radical SAM protein [Anaerolineaceae bacterium]